MKILKLSAACSFFFALSTAMAQSGQSDIWLIELSQNSKGQPEASAPLRITENDYYDNQPSFSGDGSLIFYASMPDTLQSDIYEYNTKRRTVRQITNTPESEFQPQLIPFDQSKLSVVRVDTDKAQRLYEVKLDGTEFSMLMPNEDSVAYYCWMNDTTIGVSMLNGGMGSLHQYDMIPLQSIILMQGNFGRCLSRIPGTNNLAFVQKGSDGNFSIIQYEMGTEERTSLAVTLPGVEDFCIGADRKIYMADKGKLFYYDSMKEDAKWEEIADYSKSIGNFYRLALSPKGDRMALVSFSGTRP